MAFHTLSSLKYCILQQKMIVLRSLQSIQVLTWECLSLSPKISLSLFTLSKMDNASIGSNCLSIRDLFMEFNSVKMDISSWPLLSMNPVRLSLPKSEVKFPGQLQAHYTHLGLTVNRSVREHTFAKIRILKAS